MFLKKELNVCDLNTAPTRWSSAAFGVLAKPAGRSSPRSRLVNRVRAQFLVRVVCRNPDVGIGHLSLRRLDRPDLKSTRAFQGNVQQSATTRNQCRLKLLWDGSASSLRFRQRDSLGRRDLDRVSKIASGLVSTAIRTAAGDQLAVT
ncbi:hypothetical protein [Mesorhizobium sp. M1295]|uniref:hypothetical protein n=1 Tax=Mesorhizobium sp. M1295 TaxID=2957076 RepID=UPI003338CEF4